MEPKINQVTVENLINSLAQIEVWIKAVRTALATMDRKTVIGLSDKDLKAWTDTAFSPIRTGRECPPPD